MVVPTRAEVRKQILTCTRCPLHQLANGPIPFRGPDHPQLLVIGEAPGRWEDRQHKPFIGPSGALIGKLLSVAGYDVTSEVAYANTVSCWPNRTPTSPSWNEIDSCAMNLDAQIDYLQPERIVLVGMVAVSSWWPNLAMKQIRARWFTVKGVPAMATYHPAAVLRDTSLMPVLQEDLERVRLGPSLSDSLNYECVWCGKEAEVWVSEGKDVTNVMGGLGVGWCVRDLRYYRRHYRGAGGGAQQGKLL